MPILWWTLWQLKSKNPITRDRVARKLIGDGNINPVVELLNHDQPAFRMTAVQILGEARNVHFIPHLGTALRDTDPEIRKVAVRALAATESLEALDPIIDGLSDRDSSVKAEAGSALSSFCHEKAVEPLLKFLEISDTDVQSQIADLVGEIGDRRAVPSLISVFKPEGRGISQNAIAEALGKLGDSSAIGPLVIALNNSSDQVQKTSEAALNRIDPNWADSQAAKDELGVLLSALSVSVHPIGKPAIRAIAKIGDTSTIETLFKLLEENHCEKAIAVLDEIKPDWKQSVQAKGLLTSLVTELLESNSVRRAEARSLINAIDPSLEWVAAVHPDVALAVRKEDKLLHDLVMKANEDVLSAFRTQYGGSIDYSYWDRTVRTITKNMYRPGEDFVGRLIEEITHVYNFDLDARIRRFVAVTILGQAGDERAVNPLRKYIEARGLPHGKQASDYTTETLYLVQRSLTVAVAAVNKLTDQPQVERSPSRLIIFREGSDQPDRPEDYYREVVKLVYGDKGTPIAAWRITGTVDPISESEAGRLYDSNSWSGGLPNWGAPIKVWKGKGTDDRSVVALFFE